MAPLLAVSSSEALSFLSTPQPPTGALPLVNLTENSRALRKALEKIETIDISSHPSSPLIHIRIAPGAVLEEGGDAGDMSALPSRDDQESLLQDIVDECLYNGVLVTRQKRVWEQEMNLAGDIARPSIRICMSAALSRKEVEKAAQVVKAAIVKVLGKKRRRATSP
jgi:serine palmitoyltransferase